MQRTFYFSDECIDLKRPEIKAVKVGDPALVLEFSSETAEFAPYFGLRFDAASVEEGEPANLNRSIRRFHGWRGTSYGTAVYAHGVYLVKSVEVQPDGGIKIVIGSKDIKAEEE